MRYDHKHPSRLHDMSSVRPMGKQCRSITSRIEPSSGILGFIANVPAMISHTTRDILPNMLMQITQPLLVVRLVAKPVRGKLHPIEDRRSVGRTTPRRTLSTVSWPAHSRGVDGDPPSSYGFSRRDSTSGPRKRRANDCLPRYCVLRLSSCWGQELRKPRRMRPNRRPAVPGGSSTPSTAQSTSSPSDLIWTG